MVWALRPSRRRRLSGDFSHCFVERKYLLLLAAQAAQGDLALLGLAAAHDGDDRDLGQALRP